jgi:hypothetical protein
VPRERLSSAAFRKEVKNTQRRKTAPDLRRLFIQTTEGWKNVPFFADRLKELPQSIGTTVWPFGNDKAARQYRLVTLGSPPHLILPKRAKVLRFRTGYRSATRPGSLVSRPARRFGPFASARAVSHPGFDPRNFDALIAEVYEPQFIADMDDAFSRAAPDTWQ